MSVISDRTQERVVKARRARPTRHQRQLLRFEDWRRQHDEGCPDPNGRIRRRSIREIAWLYGFSPAHVHRGILAARRLRQEVVDAVARLEA